MSASYSSSQVALILLNGVIGGAVWVVIAHLVRPYTRQILAAILVAAAAFYLKFAIQGDAGATWIAVETLGIAAFGALAIAGVRGSAWWLIAGWALHPVWDLALHTFGSGSFAPAEYPIACLTWDWVTAGYLAWRAARESRAAAQAAGDHGLPNPTLPPPVVSGATCLTRGGRP